MKIDFQIVPHKRQRYDTVGDYFFIRRILNFRISKMSDARYPILVFLHEMIEFFMCRLAGVKMKDIDRFDMEYERTRVTKLATNLDISVESVMKQRYEIAIPLAPCGCVHKEEPGDDEHAPYYMQHQTATACEKLIAKALGVGWKKYETEVESL